MVPILSIFCMPGNFIQNAQHWEFTLVDAMNFNKSAVVLDHFTVLKLSYLKGF